MIYEMHSANRAVAASANFFADAWKQALTHPLTPFRECAAVQNAAAVADLTERLTRNYTKPSFGIDSVMLPDGRSAEIVEETVAALPFCKLTRFRKEGVAEQGPKILLVAPASGHFATLLRGTVRRLAPEADVHVTEWANAREVPVTEGPFSLDGYIDYLMGFIETMGGSNVHVMAVCQPAPVTLSAVARIHQEGGEPPASMTLMGGPIDTEAAPTEVTKLAESKPLAWFAARTCSVPVGFPGAGRQVYPGFFQLFGFLMMNPDSHVRSHMDYYEHLVAGDGDSAEAHRKFYDEFLSVRDEDAKYFLDTIDAFFHRNALARGEFTHRGQPVDPSAITRTAVMTVEGERDDISAPGQTHAAHRLCDALPEGMKRHHLQEGCGHYGQFNGRRWREEIAPKILDFVREFDR